MDMSTGCEQASQKRRLPSQLRNLGSPAGSVFFMVLIVASMRLGVPMPEVMPLDHDRRHMRAPSGFCKDEAGSN
jgi:hypothetical protein